MERGIHSCNNCLRVCVCLFMWKWAQFTRGTEQTSSEPRGRGHSVWKREEEELAQCCSLSCMWVITFTEAWPIWRGERIQTWVQCRNTHLTQKKKAKQNKNWTASEVFHCEPWIYQGHCCVTGKKNPKEKQQPSGFKSPQTTQTKAHRDKARWGWQEIHGRIVNISRRHCGVCVMQSPAYRLSSQVTWLARGRRGAAVVLHLNIIINGEVWLDLGKARWTEQGRADNNNSSQAQHLTRQSVLGDPEVRGDYMRCNFTAQLK